MMTEVLSIYDFSINKRMELNNHDLFNKFKKTIVENEKNSELCVLIYGKTI